MKRNVFPLGRTQRSFAFWRSERGITIAGLLVAAAVLLASIAAYDVFTKKVPSLQAAFIPLRNCGALVKGAIDGLVSNYAVHDDRGNPVKDANGNIVFPDGLNLTEDDPIVVALRQCQAIQKTFSDSVKAGNFQAINDLNNQIDMGLRFVAQCRWGSATKFRAGTAGIDFSDGGVEAFVNFSATGSDGGGQITATGTASGGGAFYSKTSPNWLGNIAISGNASQNAAGTTSQVTFTATAPATRPKNADGSCPGASINDGGRCVQILQMDGTCPPGQTPTADGRCLISCPSADVREIIWMAPNPPKVEAFKVDPMSIDKDRTDPIKLDWVISNAKSYSIDHGVNPDTQIPQQKWQSSVASFAFIPPPKESTTYQLLALGVGPFSNAVATATVVVKEPEKPVTVVITSPKPDDQILEEGVTVTGVVAPVPDPDHRTVQILTNGALLQTATLDAGGNFSARTALLNTISRNDIKIVSIPSVFVTRCGAISLPVAVSVEKAGSTMNLISVRVPLAGDKVASASVQVEHVISVSEFAVQWGGDCGELDKDIGRSLVLRNGDFVEVGTVDCGFTGPAHCSATVNLTVVTSVGTFTPSQSWRADIDSCSF